jgi:hypothetical protein
MYGTKIIRPGYVSPKESREGKGSLEWAILEVTKFLNESPEIEPISVQYIDHHQEMCQTEMSISEHVVTYTAVILYKEI